MKKIRNFFELNRPYRFEVTDLTTFIYLLCSVLGMCGMNVTPLFCLGAVIATAFCWQARRINLVVLNVSLLVFNVYNLILMF